MTERLFILSIPRESALEAMREATPLSDRHVARALTIVHISARAGMHSEIMNIYNQLRQRQV
jgi:hypothetical protein